MHNINNSPSGRPRKKRCCRKYQADLIYKPQGIPMREIEVIPLELDEFEAMRLCDYDELDQTEAGEKMSVSRGTVQRLLYSARKKLVKAILNKNALALNLTSQEVTNDTMHSHQRRQKRQRQR